VLEGHPVIAATTQKMMAVKTASLFMVLLSFVAWRLAAVHSVDVADYLIVLAEAMAAAVASLVAV
jgi:uncharacterized membrane protein